MAIEYRTDDWDRYRMSYQKPHEPLEPIDREIEVVNNALRALVDAGVLPTAEYEKAKMVAMREAVRAAFDIPWTAITPRMQRLIYAINAIARPARMIAAGCFCGNTFICNAGAAVGPGAVYEAEELVGLEIREEEAARAERNVRALDPTGKAHVLAADATEWVAAYAHPIDLLYLDASAPESGKSIYLDITRAGMEKLPAGALVLAHNSVNGGEAVEPFLDFVRDPANFRSSVNVVLDPEGLEVSVK